MTKDIVEPLLAWYKKNKRDLPWRKEKDPYRTWVSEIMLQQTRVEAAKPYFLRFMKELPDIRSLAECPEERLLKLWEGLGYYSRARNLKSAAMYVTEHCQGRLPESYEELRKLPGIGPYTAGAIASIAMGIPVPAADGNVFRIAARLECSYLPVTDPAFRRRTGEELSRILPVEAPGDFNQALMDLGAMVCLPNGEPKCAECPLSGLCEAGKKGVAADLPVREKKKERKVQKRTVLVIQDGELTMIRKRPDRGLLAGLFELPNLEGHLNEDEALAYARSLALQPLRIERLEDAVHIFSHLEWRMRAYRIRVASLEDRPGEGSFFIDRKEKEESVAIPSAFQAYTRYL